jgi:hypothetical protein
VELDDYRWLIGVIVVWDDLSKQTPGKDPAKISFFMNQI